MSNHEDWKWILDAEGNPVREPDVIKWAQWYEKIENRRVKRTKIGGLVVSTVFLGLNMNHWSDGPPVLWETVVLPITDGTEKHNRRHASRDEALRHHRRVARSLRGRAERAEAN